MKWLVVALLAIACNGVEPQSSVNAPTDNVNPAAVALQETLLQTARANDVDGFKALWSAESIRILDEHFEQMELLQRTPNESPYGWQQFMQIHADLPTHIDRKAAYPIIMEKGRPKVDLSSHPDVGFLRHEIHANSNDSETQK